MVTHVIIGSWVCKFWGRGVHFLFEQPCHDKCVGKLYLVVVRVQGSPVEQLIASEVSILCHRVNSGAPHFK